MQCSYNHADEIISPNNTTSIWIGDLQSAQNLQWLKSNHIKTVITAAQGVTLNYDQTIKHIHYKLQDNKRENIAKVLEQAADLIQKGLKIGSILVHCGAGVSRSSTLVIGYLIKYKKMDFLSALKLTKSKRPVICPNLGFQLQLKSFEKLLKSRQMIGSLKSKALQLPQIQNYSQHIRSPLLRTSKNMLKPSFQKGSLDKLTKPKLSRQSNSVVGNRFGMIIDGLGYGIGQKDRLRQTKQRDLQYLKKMAMFRFGMTNIENWKLG